MKKKNKISDLPELVADWSEIRHFFIWHNRSTEQNYFVLIDRYGSVSYGIVRGKQQYEEFYTYCEKWKEHIGDQTFPTEYLMPNWTYLKECKHTLMFDLIMKISVLVAVVLLAIVAPHRGGLFACGFFVLLLMLVNLTALCVDFSGKRISQLSLHNDKLKVAFSNGKVRSFDFSDIKYYGSDQRLINSFIHFLDGTQLNNLQHLSQWPVLRDYIDSKVSEPGLSIKIFSFKDYCKSSWAWLTAGLISLVGVAFTAHGSIFYSQPLVTIFMVILGFCIMILVQRFLILQSHNKYVKTIIGKDKE